MSGKERKLDGLMSRLESHFATPEARRLERIQSLMGQFKDRKTPPERDADHLVAYLFTQNRERFGKTYDFEKEGRQIKAVVDILEGHHVHLGTGEGKSSVVLPIAGIVDALTSPKRSANLVTTDEALLQELRDNTEFFHKSLTGVFGENYLTLEAPTLEESEALIDEPLKKEMVREALIGDEPSYGDSLKKLQKRFWEREFAADKKQERPEEQRQDNAPRLNFMTDRNLVFGYQADPDRFAKETGNIFFDEADTPYQRRSSYVRVGDEQFFTAEDVRESSASWLVRFVVARRLDEKSFEVDKTGYTLTEKARRKLGRIKLKSIREDEFFGQGVDIIAEELRLTAKQKKQMEDNLAKEVAGMDRGDGSDLVGQIGEDMARLHRTEGVRYVMGEETPKVRDSYIDQFLDKHRFSYEDELNILAQKGKFDFVSLHPVSFKNTTLQTFIQKNADLIRCTSGTLMYPDPESGQIKASPFGSFLEEVTGKTVEVGLPPEIKEPPAPQVFGTEKETIAKMVDSLPDKPTLIVSYQIEESKKIYDELAKRLGDQVAYVETKPTEKEALLEYQKRVKEIYQDLADGKLKAVVSSGAAGFGVNIVGRDGTFPDLHVMIHDLPANRAQLMQILGRRRAPGSDFSWFVSREFLRPYIAVFDDKVSQFAHALGKLDILEIDQQLGDSNAKPETIRKIVMEILIKAESIDRTDDEFTLSFENYVTRKEDDLRKRLNEEVEKLGLNPLTENFMAEEIGLPDSLRSFMTDYLPLIPATERGRDAKGVIASLNRYLEDQGLLSGFSDYWFARRRETVAGFFDAVTQGGEMVFHDPVQKGLVPIFISYEADPKDPQVRWGIARAQRRVGSTIEWANFLSYTKNNQVYLLHDAKGNDVVVPRPEEAQSYIERATSEQNYNLFGRRYSFWYNKSSL